MYLARSSMEITILALIFGFIVFMTIANNRAKERRERLRIIEEAIRKGNLEPHVQEELVQELTGRRVHRPVPQQSARGSLGPARWLFGIGWLGLFVGIAVLIAGGIDGDDEVLMGGCVVTAISFGVMSLPMAMRELDRSRHRA